MMQRHDADFKAVLDVLKREFPSLSVEVEGTSPDRFICVQGRNDNDALTPHLHWWETGWHYEDDEVLEWVEGLSSGLRRRLKDTMQPHIVRKRLEGI